MGSFERKVTNFLVLAIAVCSVTIRVARAFAAVREEITSPNSTLAATGDSVVWHSFRHSLIPGAESMDDKVKTRNRRHPIAASAVSTVHAFVDNAVIIKLDRIQYLDELTEEKSLGTPVEPNPVEFFPSLDGKPSLPSWLNMVHPSLYDNAFLYGTPPSSKFTRFRSGSQKISTVRLCVIALHKEFYASITRFIDIQIHVAPPLNYQVHLVLLNYRLANFLAESVSKSSSSLRRVLTTQWEDDVSLIRVSSSSSSSAVVAHFGSSFPMHERLKIYAVKASVLRGSHRCKGSSRDASPSSEEDPDIEGSSPMFAPKFDVDWCRFAIVEKSHDDASDVASRSDSFASRHRPRSLPLGASPPHRFDDFVLFVVLPAMVLVIVVVLLACFMFGHRKGSDDDSNDGRVAGESENRPVPTADTTQLRRYNSVRQASESLRLLSSSNRVDDASCPTSSVNLGVPSVTETALSSIPVNSSIFQRRFRDRPQLVGRSQSFALRSTDAAPPSTVNTVDGRVVVKGSYANPLYSQQLVPLAPTDNDPAASLWNDRGNSIPPSYERGSLRSAGERSFSLRTNGSSRRGAGGGGGGGRDHIDGNVPSTARQSLRGPGSPSHDWNSRASERQRHF